MISVAMAERLERAGVRWRPRDGDRFCLRAAGFAGEVFTVAEMVIEVREHPTGTLLAFNGTTEWALDSIPATDVLWLPREDQLRAWLGERFVALERAGGVWVVTYLVSGANRRTREPDPEDAYARAVLDVLEGS